MWRKKKEIPNVTHFDGLSVYFYVCNGVTWCDLNDCVCVCVLSDVLNIKYQTNWFEFIHLFLFRISLRLDIPIRWNRFKWILPNVNLLLMLFLFDWCIKSTVWLVSCTLMWIWNLNISCLYACNGPNSKKVKSHHQLEAAPYFIRLINFSVISKAKIEIHIVFFVLQMFNYFYGQQMLSNIYRYDLFSFLLKYLSPV